MAAVTDGRRGLVGGTVRVSVPATSANLGPGYDSLGLALDLRDELAARVVDGPTTVAVTGEGAGEVPTDASHLVVRALHAAVAAAGLEPPAVALECRNVVPHSRGLGSSSAAIVAGVALGVALVADPDRRPDGDAMLQLVADLEGHPDNVAPALLGGLVASARLDPAADGAAGWLAVRAEVDPRVAATAFVPPTAVATSVARGLLPADVSHGDAAANAGRVALLVLALTGRPEHLLAGTHDLLHQQYRAPAMPASLDLVRVLRAAGVAAFVSGAGPTVLALSADGGDLTGWCPAGWRALRLAVDPVGVRPA